GALDTAIPWVAPEARRAPTIHVAASLDELSVTASELARGLLPTDPFLVMGQYSMADETRAPAGKETAWAYTHVPQRIRGDVRWDEAERERMVERIEARIEALAPGFRDRIRARHVLAPPDLEAADRNLVGG